MSRVAFAAVLACSALASAACVDAFAGDAELAGLAKRKLIEPITAAARRTTGSSQVGAPQHAKLAPQHLYLVRSVLASLSDANRTGNYSVLRDLASPQFQAKHTAADLAQVFAPARAKPIDLSAALYLEPLMTEATIEENTLLRLKGYFSSQPERLLFAMAFEAVNGHWRLGSLSIASEPVATTVAKSQ